MRSIKFPKMFNSSSTRVWKSNEYHEATIQNSMLVLKSERGSLFGDPYWGLIFKNFMFDPNNKVLHDQLVDMIYTQLVLFMPQLILDRNAIKVFANANNQKGTVYCVFTAKNKIDYKNDTYSLSLFTMSDSNK